MRIGVFDSGIGGLTVLRKMLDYYPNNEYVYYGDTINLPYGTKSKDELRVYANRIIDFLIKEKCELIIIACGTVSSNLYEEIKNKYKIKIIDVLTPTAKYIEKNKLNNLGLIATNMTIKSKTFEKITNKKILSIATPEFVPIIENNTIHKNAYIVKKYINLLNECDNIILGCTHYPLLINEIKKYTQSKLINMGDCIVEYLDVSNIGKQNINIYFSKIDDTLIHNINDIIKEQKEINIKIL